MYKKPKCILDEPRTQAADGTPTKACHVTRPWGCFNNLAALRAKIKITSIINPGIRVGIGPKTIDLLKQIPILTLPGTPRRRGSQDQN